MQDADGVYQTGAGGGGLNHFKQQDVWIFGKSNWDFYSVII
jgi:hypothetical protein